MFPIYKVEPKNDIPPALASKVTWGKPQIPLRGIFLPFLTGNQCTVHTCLQHEALWLPKPLPRESEQNAMSSAPPPTTLTLLSQIPSHAPGSKLRFLGYVSSYDTHSGILELQHAYPKSSTKTIRALVDVNVILETLRRDDLEVGAWVNVLAYVNPDQAESDTKRLSSERHRAKPSASGATSEGGNSTIKVKLQAVMLWSAGAIKIADYERAVESKMHLDNPRTAVDNVAEA